MNSKEIERYRHAKQAVNAGSALNLLEASAQLLEVMPHIDWRLSRLTSRTCAALRKEQQRMLDVMDAEHAKAGTPRPY